MRITSFIKYLRKDDGMTTAEYAVGTIATASLGGILIKILTSAEVRAMIVSIIEKALSGIFN